MPIRTRRGRAAAYRALWEWPLHSPARLLACLVALVVAVGAASALSGMLAGGGDRDRAALGPAPPQPVAGPPPTVPAAPLAPPELTPRTLSPRDAPRAALEVATRWTAAWATHPPGMTPARWSASLAPYTTPEYLGVLATVDPANVPATRVTGPVAPVSVRPDAMRALVPTDAVRLELLLVRTGPGDWRVAGYDQAP